MVKNFVNLMKETEKTEFVISETNGKYSFGLVYNKNGKRLSVSKALAEKLEIKDNMYLCPLFDHCALLIGKNLPDDKAWHLNLKGSDKKISYSAEAAETLVRGFNLDYTDVSSKSFTNISFEDFEGSPVAVIKISDKTSAKDEKVEE